MYSFELFGFDFMLGADLKVLLLEVRGEGEQATRAAVAVVTKK